MNGGGRRYRILGTLGRGGFGTVYRADLLGESGFTRQVALKVLNTEMENVATVAQRLRDEARLLGLLRHRAIVDVDGLVRLDNRWTVVMEFISGADLSRLEKHGAVPQGPALEIIGEVASALHVAYTTPGPTGEPLRLLHRDIKPQNIIVTPAGEVKVLDFGVARADYAGREAQTRHMLLGSLGYMAPERFEHRDGPGSDVYAMGVLLWEMLSGAQFGRISIKPDKFAARRQEALDQLSKGGQVMDEIVTFVGDMLQFRPDERPSARDVERRCRDLRLEVRGAWLRDWAEEVIPPLVLTDADLDAHDFPSDIVTESQASPDLDGGWPEPPPTPAPAPTPTPSKRTAEPAPRRRTPEPAPVRPPPPPLATESKVKRASSTLFPEDLDEESSGGMRAPATWDAVAIPPAPDSTHHGPVPARPAPKDAPAPDSTHHGRLPQEKTYDDEATDPSSGATPSPAPVATTTPAPAVSSGGGGAATVLQVVGILGVPVVLFGGGLVLLLGFACCGILATGGY